MAAALLRDSPEADDLCFCSPVLVCSPVPPLATAALSRQSFVCLSPFDDVRDVTADDRPALAQSAVTVGVNEDRAGEGSVELVETLMLALLSTQPSGLHGFISLEPVPVCCPTPVRPSDVLCTPLVDRAGLVGTIDFVVSLECWVCGAVTWFGPFAVSKA